MKKSKFKLIIIFSLWIFLGFFLFQLKYQLNILHSPVVSQWFFDFDGIIKSIWDVVKNQNIWSDSAKYQRFDEVYDILKNSYFDQDKLQTGLMITSAVKAFVDAIDDPYTVYMDAQQSSGFKQEIKWESDFEWIWAVVQKKDYYVLIEEVLKESPAYRAWIMALDRVVMIETWSVKDLTIDQAISKIKWPKWTEVKLIIERIKKDWTKEILEKKVTRDKLILPSVNNKIFTWSNKWNIWYLNISIIWEETEKILKQNILEIKTNDVKWIIIDLRWNWWWLLPISVEILSHFVPKDKLVVTAKYKNFNDEIFNSKWYGDFENLPIVVLMDGMTASAWEIISMALQEQAWAKLVWTQSFGKWSIQTIDNFSDWDSVKYTIGKRYAPSGKNINKIWVTPDVLVEFDTEKYSKEKIDNQLEKAKEVLYEMMK